MVYGDHGHAPAAHARRPAALVRARGGRRPRSYRPGELRNRSCPFHRAWPLGAEPARLDDAGRAFGHHWTGARSGVRAAYACQCGPGSIGVRRVHHTGRDDAQPGVRARRSISRCPCGAARAGLCVDGNTDRAPRAGHHAGQRCGLPGDCRTAAVPRRVTGATGRRSAPQSRIATRALEAWHLGRQRDGARDDRDHGWVGHAPRTVRRAPLLASPRTDGRSGDRQHAHIRLPAGTSRRDQRCHGRLQWRGPR